MTNQQRCLGWGHVSLENSVFRCKWSAPFQNEREADPLSAKVCRYLTNALRYNGNVARCWKAEGFESEQVSYATWVLRENGKVRAVLTVDHLPISLAGIQVDSTPIKEEQGSIGLIRELHEWIALNNLDYRIPRTYQSISGSSGDSPRKSVGSCSLLLALFVSILGVGVFAADSAMIHAQSTRSPAPKRVMLGNDGKEVPFFLSERVFNLSCRVQAAGKVSREQAESMRDGMLMIDSGTEAFELSRAARFKKIENTWIGKVHVKLTSGPHKGRIGYVVHQSVLPFSRSRLAQPNYPIVSLYDRVDKTIFVAKELAVFELAVRLLAREELTNEERGVLIRGLYKLTKPTKARLISSKDHIPTSDGRYVGWTYVEIAEGPYKGRRGYIFIDQVHR